MEIRQASVESYAVRIYRRERDQGLIGVVELPAREKKMSFRSFEELQAILLREFWMATSQEKQDPDAT